MTVLNLTADSDHEGVVHIEIPTALPDQSIDLVVVVGPTGRGPGPRAYDFSDLAGRLNWAGDAVKQQRELRDEW